MTRTVIIGGHGKVALLAGILAGFTGLMGVLGTVDRRLGLA